jgi:hypothetical protein
MTVKSKLAELETKVENLVKDAAVLTVRTFSGPVTATFNTATNTWTLSNNDKLTLRAYTTIKLDGDTDTVLPVADGGAIDKDIVDIHQSVLKAATEARAAMWKGIVDLFK